MDRKQELYYLIIATLALRLLWVFMVPMFEAPDETTHFYMIKFMAEHLQLPGPEHLTAGGEQSVYVPLPPFGYIPHVIAMWSLSWLFDPSLAPRFGSFLLSPLLTYCAWWLSGRLFPSSRLCAFAVPALIVFHPQLVLVHSYANNDVTAITLAAILLCLTVRSIERGLTLPLSCLVGLLSGWLALSKYSGYPALPAVAFGFLVSAWLHRTSLKQIVTCCGSSLLLAGLVCFPWFYRNYQLYDGDFMGTQTMRKHWALLFNKPLQYYVSPIEIALNRKWWRMMFFSYWGMFGYMTRPLIKPLYWIYTGFLLAAAIGMIRRSISVVKSGIVSKLKSSERKDLILPATWATMVVAVLANLLAMILASTGNVGGPQGRYLFTSEIPVLALLVAGLYLIGNVWGKRMVIAILVFNVVVYVWSVAMLFPIYGLRWKTF